jgi:hypothetical protein
MAAARQSRPDRAVNVFFVNSTRCGTDRRGKSGPVYRALGMAAIPGGLKAEANRTKSNSARLDVTKDVASATQEYDSMSCRIRFVPFELVVWDFDFSSDIDVRTSARFVGPVVGDGRVRLPILDVNLIRPIGIRLAATRSGRNVGLHQGLVPLPDRGIHRIPLSEVAGIHNANHATKRQAKDDAFHFALLSISGVYFKAMFVPRIS